MAFVAKGFGGIPMKRWLFALLAMAPLVMIHAPAPAAPQKKPKSDSSQSSASTPLDPKGKWAKYHIGEPRRFVIWHDAAGYHVRTTCAPKHKVIFVGTILVKDGQFAAIGGFQNLEKGKPKNIQNADYGYWNTERNRLEFKFTTAGKEDAFDFTLTPNATSVEFILRVDNETKGEYIFIGKDGRHPPTSSFTLPANP
jgi:hypothetical protein